MTVNVRISCKNRKFPVIFLILRVHDEATCSLYKNACKNTRSVIDEALPPF